VILAIFISDIGPVFSLIGAICANGISFVLPAAFYIMLRRKKRKVYHLAVGLFVFGLISGVVCLVGEIMKNF
jgi:amino acid permease